MDIYTGGRVMDYSFHILTSLNSLKLKHINNGFASYSFSLYKTLLLDWSHVDYCDVLISCLDSHSDGTHSLHWIHW